MPHTNHSVTLSGSEKKGCPTYEWVVSHIWIRNVNTATSVWPSAQKDEWASHLWMSHVTYMNDSCHTYEWVMSHICMSHATHMNESCQTYEWVMSHIWMSHVTRQPQCDPQQQRHEGASIATYLLHLPPLLRDMTHSYVWHDLFVCVHSHLFVAFTSAPVWHESFMCVTCVQSQYFFAFISAHDIL